MRRLILILISLMLGILMGRSQADLTDIMLFGDVRSARDQQHIPFANISVKGSRLGTTCDASGHFKFANLPEGQHTLLIQAMGYKTKEVEVRLSRNETRNFFFVLEPDVFNLDQVVITGTRSSHHIKDVPVRTEVITMKDIENKNACNLYEALEGVAGLRVESQCQACDFTMLRMQGLGAEHTQVLVDGQPVYSGLAGVYGLKQISTLDIGRIEVVKGAGSSLYGSGAIAGAINIVSREPSTIPTAKLDMQYGSYHSARYGFTSSMRNEKGNIGVSLYAQHIREAAIDVSGEGATVEEVRQPDGISDRVATSLKNAGVGLYFDEVLKDKDQLVLRAKFINEHRQGGVMVDDVFRNPFTEGTENIITHRYQTELGYTLPLRNGMSIDYRLNYVNHQREATNDSYLGDYLATHGDTAPDVREMRPYLAEEQSWNSSVTLEKRSLKYTLTTGIQLSGDVLEESGMYVVVDEESPYYGSSYRSTSRKSALESGIFVQGEWQPTRKLTVVPGLRFDFHRSTDQYFSDQQVSDAEDFPVVEYEENSLNPRLAVKYKLNDKISLRASAGTGFRAPFGFSEDLHLCSGSPRVWKSVGLSPERSFSINTSGDYYGDRIRISLNLFRTRLNDMIAFSNATEEVAAKGYDYQWVNVDDALVQGVEFSLMVNLQKDLDAGIDFTFNDGRYDHIREDWDGTEYAEESRYISRFPRTSSVMRLEYSPGKWMATAFVQRQGYLYIDYYHSPEQGEADLSLIRKTPAHNVVNMKVSRGIQNWKVYAGVDNVFDTIQDERRLDDAAFIYAPIYGRMLYAGISLDLF